MKTNLIKIKNNDMKRKLTSRDEFAKELSPFSIEGKKIFLNDLPQKDKNEKKLGLNK